MYLFKIQRLINPKYVQQKLNFWQLRIDLNIRWVSSSKEKASGFALFMYDLTYDIIPTIRNFNSSEKSLRSSLNVQRSKGTLATEIGRFTQERKNDRNSEVCAEFGQRTSEEHKGKAKKLTRNLVLCGDTEDTGIIQLEEQ